MWRWSNEITVFADIKKCRRYCCISRCDLFCWLYFQDSIVSSPDIQTHLYFSILFYMRARTNHFFKWNDVCETWRPKGQKDTVFHQRLLPKLFYVLLSESSSRAKVFCKKGVFRNFTKFTEKHLCQSLFLKAWCKSGTRTPGPGTPVKV